MADGTIVQFVGFITNADFDKFVDRWSYYVKELGHTKVKATLQKQSGSKARFKYLSKHSGPPEGFKFTFMNKRDSEHFPEHNAKVVHAGGYVAVQTESNDRDKNRWLKAVVFIKDQQADMDFYRRLQFYRKLNIYQAYYENCAYAWILEYYLKETEVPEFMPQLSKVLIDEVAFYEECPVVPA